MGWQERLRPPFEGAESERAVAAYGNAAYMHVRMNVGLDRDSGKIIIENPDTEETQQGSPGEILTREDFFIPAVDSIQDLIDLAFMLGYLMDKLEQPKIE